MLNGWISLRVKDPKAIAEWYREVTGLEMVGARQDIGSIALRSQERGLALPRLTLEATGQIPGIVIGL